VNRVVITNRHKEEFKTLVDSIFKDKKLIKNDKKIKWEITKDTLDVLLQKKLKNFDSKISFDKLIIADFKYIKSLKEYIDNNQKRVELSENEKDYFLTLYGRLKKSQYIKTFGVNVCLYCNRNYIFNFKKAKSLEATGQLDHFFDKKSYPYLAISLYNLVPCCSTCNQRKSTKQSDILHPFVDNFDKRAKFTLKIKNSSFYYSTDGFEININPIDSKDTQVKNSIDIFNLNRLYQNHQDIILELIQKDVVYNESYLDELYKKYEGTLFKNKEDLQRLISGGYIEEEQINNRPLSKLIKDITIELGI
jgi:uncharacterized protein (TIGR02646 family)